MVKYSLRRIDYLMKSILKVIMLSQNEEKLEILVLTDKRPHNGMFG